MTLTERMFPRRWILVAPIICLTVHCHRDLYRVEEPNPSDLQQAAELALPVLTWQSLLSTESLPSWQPSPFAGAGETELGAGRLQLGMGEPLTGMTFVGEFPQSDYAIRIRGQRVRGHDFFCGLTFSVGDSALSLILGGWGGSLVGLSCLDGLDASENETKQFHSIPRNKPIEVALHVRQDRIMVWLQRECIIDQRLTGRTLSIRPEVEPSLPLGIASYQTQSTFADISWRPLATHECR